MAAEHGLASEDGPHRPAVPPTRGKQREQEGQRDQGHAAAMAPATWAARLRPRRLRLALAAGPAIPVVSAT
jgi:hypothetical protein